MRLITPSPWGLGPRHRRMLRTSHLAPGTGAGGGRAGRRLQPRGDMAHELPVCQATCSALGSTVSSNPPKSPLNRRGR